MRAKPLTGRNFKYFRPFRNSLAGTMVLLLLALSLFPVLLLGGATYLRSRALLRDQTALQLQAITQVQVDEIEASISDGKSLADMMINDFLFQITLTNYLNEKTNPQKETNLYNILISYQDKLNTHSANNDNQILLFSPDGNLILSSNTLWRSLDFTKNRQIMALLGSEGTTAIYNPAPVYINQVVMFTTRKIVDDQNNLKATLVWTATSPLFRQSLISSQSFFPTAQSFFMTSAGEVLETHPSTGFLRYVADFTNYERQLTSIIQQEGLDKATRLTSVDGVTPVLGIIRWIPSLKLGYILQVPEEAIYGQVPILSSFNLILLGLAVLLSGIIAFAAGRSFVTPLLQLAEYARQFAQGEWNQRAHFKRKDEIGQLANAFDSMVEELTGLYRSMEQKVLARTEQVRLASEVAVLATSANNQTEMIRRTVELVVERFQYLYAGIFMIDSSGLYAELEQECQREATGQTLFDRRLRLGSDSLVGWVGANNQSNIIAGETETVYTQITMLPGARAEAAVPITLGNQVIAVLDVQSSEPNAFDSDTLSALQSLSNQVASGMQNVHLLETAEVNLAETSMLHRASRQITQAESEEQVLSLLQDALSSSIFVSGIYAVQDDHISVIAIYDAKNPSSVTSMQGLTLPLKQVNEEFKGPGYIRIEDISALTPFDHILSFYLRRGCRGAVIFPLFEAGKLAKIVVLGDRESGQLTETTISPFANLIDVASSSFSRFRSKKDLDNRLAELDALNGFNHSIAEETDPQALFAALQARSAESTGEGLELAIALYNHQTKLIELPYVHVRSGEKRTPEPFTLGTGLVNNLLMTKQPVLLNRMAQRVQDLSVKMFGKRAYSWLGIPLVVGGESIGAIIIQDSEQENRFREADIQLFSVMASSFAVSIRKAQLLAELEKALKDYQRENFLLSSWLNNTPDYAYFKDSQGRYIRAGRAYADRMGKSSPDQLIGLTDFQLYDAETAQARAQEDQALLQTRQPEVGEIREEKDENGQSSWRLRSCVPLIDESGQVTGLLSISRNVTEMKATEEQAQRAAHQLTTAAEIARDASGTLELDELLSKAVNLVRERFGFYHASIFLTDPAGIYAVLRESTGEVGRIMKERSHKLAIGSRSIVGQAAMLGESLVINDVVHDLNYYANPLLPETKAELAIPLKVGNQVLGALDVQSKQTGVYGEQEMVILKLLADQIAVAVMNANLYSRSMENLEQHRQLHEITTTAASATTTEEVLAVAAEGLKTALDGAAVSVYLRSSENALELRAWAGYPGNSSPVETLSPGQGIVGQVALDHRPLLVTGQETEPVGDAAYGDDPFHSHVAVPILYSGGLVGVLHAARPEVASFDQNTLDLLGLLANSLGAILSNASLISTVRQQVERQRLIYEATSRIHRSVDIQTILETSAIEIARAVGARKAQIKISPASFEAAENAGNGNHKNGKETLS